MKAITFEFWLHQLYRQILKGYLAVLPILIVDHSNTARKSFTDQKNLSYGKRTLSSRINCMYTAKEMFQFNTFLIRLVCV